MLDTAALKWALQGGLITPGEARDRIESCLALIECVQSEEYENRIDRPDICLSQYYVANFIKRRVDRMDNHEEIYEIIDDAYVRGERPAFLSLYISYFPSGTKSKYSKDPDVMVRNVRELLVSLGF